VAAWATHRIGDARTAFRAFSEKVLVAGDERYAWVLLAAMAKAEADDAEGIRAAKSAPDVEGRETFAAIRSIAASVPVLTAANRAAAALVEAEFARSQGIVTIESWAEASTAAEDEDVQRHLAAYIHFRAAEASAANGNRDDAVEKLKRAVPMVAGLPDGPLFQEIKLLARRARLDISDCVGEFSGKNTAVGPGTPLGLTSRELEVLALVAEGLSNRQIGERLYISTKTASAHVSNILAKLGVSGRGEAAAVAHRLRVFEA
jgi:DNA-binding NarL/FixJ family response regulator